MATRKTTKRMKAIAIGPDLGIESVPGLKKELDESLSSRSEVVLEASEVGRLHSASLQLLTAFVRARRAAGRPTRFGAVAAELKDSARILGLAQALGLDETQDGDAAVETHA